MQWYLFMLALIGVFIPAKKDRAKKDLATALEAA